MDNEQLTQNEVNKLVHFPAKHLQGVKKNIPKPVEKYSV
jgi:hypothetical protein